ncbi:hypothetical protein AIOL_003606 [Candidatus Rhodobacter oscarellae]|uniref:Uncharacterized protein n=1 Tax=Candidatus Rhodobacter oscarellae TaxID=1675527 RepID=A0A0J9GYU8_9RHOB|nr:hypothetical protein [Candidatus Rhodobacter lobularis]KMW58628.1 hypothetical protein AIOL_003606 [Candidatus Rhodobacter lobularis]
MRPIALIIAVLLAAVPAHALDIRWRSELAKPGDFVTIDLSQDGRIHHVYRGKSRGAFIVDSYRGNKPSGRPIFTSYLDAQGNFLRWVNAEGFQIRYRPHDCTRTIGKCQYTELHSDGLRERRVRVTKATRNGFSFKEYDGRGKFMFGGTIKIDERGFARDGFIKGEGVNQRFRLVKRRYQK